MSATSSIGQLHELGDLLLGGLAAELDGELALGVRDLARPRHDVDGQADGAARVGEAAADRLADPERPVGRELEALAPVELLDRADQAEHALLDQVAEGQALALVLARDRDHQAQVGVDHALLGGEIAPLDALGELDLLLGREQGMAPRFVEEELQGILELHRTRLAGLGRLRRANQRVSSHSYSRFDSSKSVESFTQAVFASYPRQAGTPRKRGLPQAPVGLNVQSGATNCLRVRTYSIRKRVPPPCKAAPRVCFVGRVAFLGSVSPRNLPGQGGRACR